MATDPEDPFNLMPLIEIQENWKAWADRSPPGYKFHPSDETLISKYLIKKQLCEALPPNNIPELTTYYSTHPEAIVVEHPLHITQDSWFFFSLRDENYPQHTKAIRDAANGYWQTTTNVPVHANNNNVIGQKRTQVFLEGKGKKKDAVKTNWHMHEYSIKIKPTPNAVDWVIVRLSPPQPKMKSLQPQNNQLQHRQLQGDFGADRSWENSAPQGPQPLQPQMVQNVNLLQPYQINQNHQMYKPQNDPLQHRQLLSDFGSDWSWENPTPQGLQAMEPQMEKNVNLLQPDLITQNQQTYHGPLQHRQLLGDFGVDQSWENPAQGPQPMQPQMQQNVNLMYQPPHDLPQFMQQLGDFGAGWSSAPQGLPPMQLPCDFGAYWSGEQPAVYEGSPFGANWSNLRGGWSREQPSTAADSLLGSNILPNANLDITQQPAVYEGSPFGANWSNLRGGWSREQPSTAADSLLGSNILPNANLDITQQNLGTNLNPTAQLGANPGGGEQMTDEEN